MEWLLGVPLKWHLKYLRNKLISHWYVSQEVSDQKVFFNLLNSYFSNKRDRFLFASIAFERPEAIHRQALQMKKFSSSGLYVVLDNSNSSKSARQIQHACLEMGVPYLKLPRTFTKHPNRSHSMALQWIFINIICNLDLDGFGYLDHDIMPVRPVDPFLKHQGCNVFGRRWDSKINQTWQLWPGFAFFTRDSYRGKKVDFFYDFSNKLDTMGMAYNSIFKYYDCKECFCSYKEIAVSKLGFIQLLDNDWLHLGRAAVKNQIPFAERFSMFENELEKIENALSRE